MERRPLVITQRFHIPQPTLDLYMYYINIISIILCYYINKIIIIYNFLMMKVFGTSWWNEHKITDYCVRFTVAIYLVGHKPSTGSGGHHLHLYYDSGPVKGTFRYSPKVTFPPWLHPVKNGFKQ